jgi:predicted transcriptional regulator
MKRATAKTARKNVYVGGSLREAARRVASAWHRAERGETVAPQDNITFLSWSALAAVMTDKRHELLRYLRRNPTPGIRALARALGRDYKRVYEDVQALMAVGLVDNEGGILRADYDEIRASIKVSDRAA